VVRHGGRGAGNAEWSDQRLSAERVAPGRIAAAPPLCTVSRLQLSASHSPVTGQQARHARLGGTSGTTATPIVDSRHRPGPMPPVLQRLGVAYDFYFFLL